MRQVAYDVGGGFGTKNSVYPEHALVLVAARRLGRPVKWINERGESFMSDTHGRDQKSAIERALANDARVLCLRVTSVGHTGAYLSSTRPYRPTAGSPPPRPGPRRFQPMIVRPTGDIHNTPP